MNARDDAKFPPVALWQINAMRFLFLLMAFVMGGFVWSQLLFEPARRALSAADAAADAL